MFMPHTSGRIEEGSILIGENEFAISRVLTQRHRVHVETPGGEVVGDFTEILRGPGDSQNLGFLQTESGVIEGEVQERRRKYDRAHYQKVFVTDSFEVVITSDEV